MNRLLARVWMAIEVAAGLAGLASNLQGDRASAGLMVVCCIYLHLQRKNGA